MEETCTFCGSRDPCVVPTPKNGALSEAYSASCVASLLTVFHIEVSDPVATRVATCADCLQLTRDIDFELRSLLKFLKNLDLLRSRLATRVKRAAGAATTNSATHDLNEKIQQEIPLVNQAFETFSNLLRIRKRVKNEVKTPEKICKQEILAFPEVKEEPFSDQDEASGNPEMMNTLPHENLNLEDFIPPDSDQEEESSPENEGDDFYPDDEISSDSDPEWEQDLKPPKKPRKKRGVSGAIGDKFAIDLSQEDDSPNSDSSDYLPSSEDSDDDFPKNPPQKDAHNSSSPNPFQCPVCFKTFAQITTKNRHFRHHHDSTFTPVECPGDNCDRVFKQFWHLKEHVEKSHPGVPIPQNTQNQKIADDEKSRIHCPVESCEKSYSRNQKVVEHMKFAHPEVPFSPIRRPKKLENGDRIPCPVETCEKSYSRNQRLYEHMEIAHPDVPLPPNKKRRLTTKSRDDPQKSGTAPKNRIPCPVQTCEKSYSRNQKVVQHVRSAHPQVPLPDKKVKIRPKIKTEEEKATQQRIRNKMRVIRRKPCPLCGKEFRSTGLSEHLKTHTGEKNHLCTKCGKLFRTARSVRQHDAEVHVKERNYTCAICGATFARKQVHDRHVATIHERPEGLRFPCDTCGKAYRHERHLKEHLQMHTSPDNLQCPICSKVFNRRENVRLHLRTVHGGEKVNRGARKSRGAEDEEEESAY